MFSPSGKLKEELVKMLKWSILGAYPMAKFDDKTLGLSIAQSKKAELGDLSISIAFRMVKITGKPPDEIAKRIVSYMKLYKMLAIDMFVEAKVENGYINMSINQKEYAKWVIECIHERKELYGSNSTGKGEKVIIESPSVNPNKPWHVGHLRNAVLGDAISNIMSACAYNVEREDYIDDLGIQVAESLWGYMNLGNKPDKKFDQWLGEQYVIVNKKMIEDKAVADQIKELNKKIEVLGSKEEKEARKVSEKCVIAQYETDANYGISHDLLVWESDIVAAKLLDKALEIADKKGVLERPKEGKYAGCITLPLEKAKDMAKEFENPMEDTKVLVRSNGTATYVAKDIAHHMWKFGLIDDVFKYKIIIKEQANKKELYSTAQEGISAAFGSAKKVINLIDTKQNYQQLILRSAFKLMGYNEIADNCIHLSYGRVEVEGGLSGRKGSWMGEDRSYTADTLLTEATAKAKEIVEQSNKVTDKSKSDDIAKAIALGAIKFEYLKISPEKSIVFSWEKALNFEGNSGPYCMYTYARATRILEKAEHKGAFVLKEKDYDQLGRGADFELLKKLGMAQEIVEKASDEQRPDIIAEYILDVSALFSSFYEKFPVIKGEEAKEIRLALVHGTRQVVKNMLLLLGIQTIEQM